MRYQSDNTNRVMSGNINTMRSSLVTVRITDTDMIPNVTANGMLLGVLRARVIMSMRCHIYARARTDEYVLLLLCECNQRMAGSIGCSVMSVTDVSVIWYMANRLGSPPHDELTRLREVTLA
jgi:hypothetical protein